MLKTGDESFTINGVSKGFGLDYLEKRRF